MKHVISPLALTLAGCALVAAVPAAADDAPPASKSSPDVAAPASAGKLPKGFEVRAGNFQASSGKQTHGSVFCPTGKVPIGGGAFVESGDLFANLGGSYPDGNAWSVDVNNIGAQTSFRIFAVCAIKPKKYQVIEASGSAAQGQQNGSFAFCPAGTVPLGGGVDIFSTSTAISVNSMEPFSNGWRSDVNNGGGGTVFFRTLLVCAKQPRGYVQVDASSIANPGATQTFVSVSCPAGTSAISGGVHSGSGDIFVNLNTSAPLGSGWQGYVNNATSSPSSANAQVICA
jgi:hypothetical protein